MKYEYAYKTSDGVRHVEEMEASSREAVFESLRAKGIKAIKVVAKDGSKSNGEVRVVGVKKRVAFASVALALIIGATVTWYATEEVQLPTEVVVTNTVPVAVDMPVTSSRQRVAVPLLRQSIQGDRQRIANAPTNLFSTAVETYLSKFAEPGREYVQVDVTSLVSNDLQLLQTLNVPIKYAEDEFSEQIDLKRITAGIKREMRAYLRGGHSSSEYFAELVKRQEIEIEYREKAEKKLAEMLKAENAKDAAYDFWMKANVQLQAMGIYPLPMPDQLRDYNISFDFD